MPRKTQPGEAGSIALLALWGLVIIGLLLAVALRTTRTELRITENTVGLARARQAAEAGTQLGLSRLLQRRAQGTMRFDGAPERWQDGTVSVDIAIIDEAGKIDINLAPIEMLSGLLHAVGRPAEEAQLIACNILDRRGDSGPSCPEPFAASNTQPRMFLVPEDLAEVVGMTGPLYEAVADYVTVATKSSAIDPFAAKRPVLLAIPGATASLVDSYLEERSRWHDMTGVDTASALLNGIPSIMTSPARDFTIEAIAVVGGQLRYRADLQVRLTDFAARPYTFVALRAPPPERGRTPIAAPPRVP